MTDITQCGDCKTAADYRKLLERGQFCVENDLDNEALRIFKDVFTKFSNPTTGEECELYATAAEGLMALRSTDNDYIWEQTGPLISQYLDWLEG